MNKFINPTHGVVDFDKMLTTIITKIQNKPDSEWIIAIGSDSQNKGHSTTFCSTVLVIEKGRGGIYFYTASPEKRVNDVQHRMLKEAELSIKLGHKVIEGIEDMYLNDKFELDKYSIKFEIHCDLGENGKSKDAIGAAIGWITAEFGDTVIAKIKPDSFAASYVADKHTK